MCGVALLELPSAAIVAGSPQSTATRQRADGPATRQADLTRTMMGGGANEAVTIGGDALLRTSDKLRNGPRCLLGGSSEGRV